MYHSQRVCMLQLTPVVALYYFFVLRPQIIIFRTEGKEEIRINRQKYKILSWLLFLNVLTFYFIYF